MSFKYSFHIITRKKKPYFYVEYEISFYLDVKVLYTTYIVYLHAMVAKHEKTFFKRENFFVCGFILYSTSYSAYVPRLKYGESE